MKATDVYRVAVIKATLKEVERALELLKLETLRRKGSWKMRAMGIQDAINLVEAYKKQQSELPEEEEKSGA